MRKNIISVAIALMAFCAVSAQAQSEGLPQDILNEAPVYLADDLASDGVCLQPSLLLNEWYADLNDGLIQPYATYSLTPEEQEAYLAIIQALWPGNYGSMQASEVNDAMADIINKMLWEISNCSKAMVSLHIITLVYNEFITGSGIKTVAQLKNFVKKKKNELLEMLGVLGLNWQYKTCVSTAALVWRSPFDIAYGDY